MKMNAVNLSQIYDHLTMMVMFCNYIYFFKVLKKREEGRNGFSPQYKNLSKTYSN